MASTEAEPQPQRNWVPATVGICHWQTATDRFGPEAKAAIRDRERVALGLHPLGHDSPFLWEPEILDEESVTRYSIHKIVPTTQLYRNNLTALSQAYNLYLVAYQSQIFVYVPRSIARQRLPRRPDCRLRCEPSSVAAYIGGYVDGTLPHSVNNLTTGFLGNEEVVVACCDDGDVYAYYTKEIAEWISLQEESPLAHPAKPKRGRSASAKQPTHFFRENVGVSAWGLAVHRQSRLIAVSSNRREVTVFAFALENASKRGQRHEQDHPTCEGPAGFVRSRSKNWRIMLALGHHAENIPTICFIDDEEGEAEKVSAVDIEGYTWIADIWTAGQPVICIGPSAGSLRRSEESIGDSSHGWGVLALPDESFLTVDTLDELLGGKPRTILRASKACSQPMADVEPCVRAIPENPCPELDSGVYRARNINALEPGQIALHAIANLLNLGGGVLLNEVEGEETPTDDDLEEEGDENDNDDDDDDDDDEDDQDMEDEDEELAEMFEVVQDFEMEDETDVSWAGDESIEEAVLNDLLNEALTGIESSTPQTPIPPSGLFHLNKPHVPCPAATTLDWHEMGKKMIYFPHSGRIARIPQDTLALSRFLKRPREVSDSLRASLSSMSRGYHLVRTYEKDIEMRSLQPSGLGQEQEIGIHCPNVLTFGSFPDRHLRPYFRATSRLNLVLHVPELSLVIVGSPIGRVLLLTPTRLARPQSTAAGYYWSHGLRVEWVLPRAADDICHGQHRRPLHGVAVGPVQDERGVGGLLGAEHAAAMPRRYRLMLHYRNHDIATFEITRQEQTGKLCIF